MAVEEAMAVGEAVEAEAVAVVAVEVVQEEAVVVGAAPRACCIFSSTCACLTLSSNTSG